MQFLRRSDETSGIWSNKTHRSISTVTPLLIRDSGPSTYLCLLVFHPDLVHHHNLKFLGVHAICYTYYEVNKDRTTLDDCAVPCLEGDIFVQFHIMIYIPHLFKEYLYVNITCRQEFLL